MNTDIITTIANLALTLSFIVALVFGIAQVRVAARDRTEHFTLGTLEAFQTRQFAEIILTVNNLKTMTHWKEIESLPKDDQVIIIQFSQQMETLGLLVAERYISLDLVDKTLGSFVITSWDKFKLMCFDARKNTPDPYLAEYFQWLAEQIEKRMQKVQREPYYLNKTPIIQSVEANDL